MLWKKSSQLYNEYAPLSKKSTSSRGYSGKLSGSVEIPVTTISGFGRYSLKNELLPFKMVVMVSMVRMGEMVEMESQEKMALLVGKALKALRVKMVEMA